MTSCDDGIIEHPIDGTLDLHTFRPEDIHSLIPEYLNECVQKGIREVRIVHGKGSGRLRKGVQDLLKKLPEVNKFQSASPDQGGWGATIVWL
ncbi:MAG: Smr domain-containing protein [Candidatus Magnetoglobus multicellularis str. Araruama]|uniref:Smr domain-containing protein n=1 Tax=Candidatus Magnetoglobus multicellularis str. Araruama TaxID=890399 RepID=A0A1V1PFB9_9BACT|nr:MAG: Smr domain-containing protein [Candidatus Magnetoglobus multicellularis str. Araruama]